MNQSNADIIIACSSGGATNSGIGIIRVSGFHEIDIFQDLLTKNLKKIKPRKVYLTKIHEKNKTIDQCLFVYFQSPHSFTGENILEFYVHGNTLVIKKVLDVLQKNLNARLAYPGEFTQRAFLNKKLSLSQVEGLDLFLNAKTDAILKKGLELLNGRLDKDFDELHEKYIKFRSSLELAIDFSEDVGEKTAEELIHNNFQALSESVVRLAKKINRNPSYYSIPEIVIFGTANSGKSSLFNKILKTNRSIVSDIPGTTRDYISEEILVSGNKFRLIDTAGIRETSNIIESFGITKANELIKNSFFKILVINPYIESERDLLKHSKIDFVLISHQDAADFDQKIRDIRPLLESKKLPYECADLRDLSGPIGPHFSTAPIGATRENGLAGPIGPQDFTDRLFELILNKFNEVIGDDDIFLQRHVGIIDKLTADVSNYNNLLSAEDDVAILASEANRLGQRIEELVGVVSSEDVLKSIFSNFCIGK